MSAWLSRNAFAVIVVLFAAGVVIASFEALDTLIDPAAATDELTAAEREEVPPVAGLIKVAIFLGVGVAIATPVERRLRAARGSR